jgi:2-keto-4-pentenoate hydratase
MNRTAIEEAVGLLVRARSGPRLARLPETCRPATVDDAHAIQEAAAAQLGEAIAGWKVAVTPEGEVARGALVQSRVVASGASLPASLVPLLGVECEVAFRFDRALPARATAYSYEEVAAAATALLAIEVVDSRFHTYPATPLLDRIADFMSNGAFVRGADIAAWRSVDLVSLDVELVADGESVVRQRGGHNAKDPLLPALALVNDLRTRGGVAAGKVVTTGTYTGLHHVKPGQAVEAVFHGVGTVTVRFA